MFLYSKIDTKRNEPKLRVGGPRIVSRDHGKKSFQGTRAEGHGKCLYLVIRLRIHQNDWRGAEEGTAGTGTGIGGALEGPAIGATWVGAAGRPRASFT